MACEASKCNKLISFTVADAQQAANFLNKMAFDIDPRAPSESQTTGFGTEKKHSNFKPLRRKWTVGGDASV